MAPMSDSGHAGDIAVGGGSCALLVVAILGANQTDSTGPIIAGSVAIIVALVTWYATDKRQSKALAAEERRQIKTLEEERGRLTLQLEHDRELEDVKHLREFLDNAAELYEQSLRATTDAAWALLPGAGDAASFPELLEEAKEEQTKLAFWTNRLRLRFPVDDPIRVTYNQIRMKTHAANSALKGATAPDRVAYEKAVAELKSAQAAFDGFCVASLEHVGARERVLSRA
jgi:hypothetical protein